MLARLLKKNGGAAKVGMRTSFSELQPSGEKITERVAYLLVTTLWNFLEDLGGNVTT